MINLIVDEAFAYDMWAITQIKALRNPKNLQANANQVQLAKEIREQVGDDKHYEVRTSREYLDLYRVNDEIYVRVDEVKIRGEQVGDHKFVDDRVYQRWLAKRALQEKWFPESKLVEQKMGYDKFEKDKT